MTENARMDCSGKRRPDLILIAAVLATLSLDAGGASAQAPAKGGTPGLSQNFSANANKPVDIEAASLIVDDKKKTATFSGSVVVVQGDVKLKSDEIVIHYVSADKPNAGKGKPAATPVSLTGGTGGSTDISTIDAVGNVVVTTVNDQNVSGDRATFDVKAQTVVIWGKNVVVSQGKTILNGERLIVNLADGTYKMLEGQKRITFTTNPMELKEQADAAKATAEAAKAQGLAKPDATKPKPKKKPAEAAPQPAPAQPAAPQAGSWIVDGPAQ